jgi:hypothetical protein
MTRRGSGQRVLPQTGASRIIASGKVGTNLSRRIQSGKRFDVEAALISLFIVVSLIWSAACFLGVGLFQSFGDYLGEAFSVSRECSAALWIGLRTGHYRRDHRPACSGQIAVVTRLYRGRFTEHAMPRFPPERADISSPGQSPAPLSQTLTPDEHILAAWLHHLARMGA